MSACHRTASNHVSLFLVDWKLTVSSFFHCLFVLKYANSSNQRDYSIHGLFVLQYVQSNQSNKRDCKQGCRSLLSIGGDNLQFYPNFALFSTLVWMNLDQEFFPAGILSEDQKKVFTKIGCLFFPEFR